MADDVAPLEPTRVRKFAHFFKLSFSVLSSSGLMVVDEILPAGRVERQAYAPSAAGCISGDSSSSHSPNASALANRTVN